jgi:uncharacterized repeat protein (TIGR01451 family)
MRPPVQALLAAAALGLLALSISAPDRAAGAFPGGNGAIAYTCFSGNSEDICTINADGSGQTQLTTGGFDRRPAWSPDGSRIVFDCGGVGICVMDADGSNRTQLPGDGYAPAWSPDGSRLVFDCFVGICVMDANGSNRAQLTDHSGDTNPVWSPDGTSIAFERRYFPGSDIYVMDADGSGQTPLTDAGPPVLNEFPDWSPDGARIAFASNRGGNDQIYTMEADGSAVTQLTSGPNTYMDPAWSPDGTEIAFDGGPNSPPTTALHVMNADGSGMTDVTGDGAGYPDWQPLTGTPPPFSNLRLRMAGPRRVGPGDPVVYAIRLRNQGPAAAEDVVVSDPIPAGTSFVRAFTARGSCVAPDPASGSPLTCSLGSMGDGSVRAIVVVVRATGPSGSTIANTATAASSTPDPDLHDNTATVTTRVG